MLDFIWFSVQDHEKIVAYGTVKHECPFQPSAFIFLLRVFFLFCIDTENQERKHLDYLATRH